MLVEPMAKPLTQGSVALFGTISAECQSHNLTKSFADPQNMSSNLLPSGCTPYPEYPSTVPRAAAASRIAATMNSGMGSVVSPMPRLMSFASGLFSWCALRRLAICTHHNQAVSSSAEIQFEPQVATVVSRSSSSTMSLNL
jgi:hypothetical protein